MSSVRFNPIDMGSFVRLPLGTSSILLAVDSIEPLHGGSRVRALIGNPSRSVLPGPVLLISCTGGFDGLGAPVPHKVDRDLPAGSWTPLTLDLPNAPIHRMGELEVSAECGAGNRQAAQARVEIERACA